MKTKKCGVYAALAAVLLISAVLITNCVDPLNGLSVPKEEQPRFTPPPGKGYIVLNFGESGSSSGRTIRPDTAVLFPNIGSFDKFDLEITDTNSSHASPTNILLQNKDIAEIEGPFTLDASDYDIEVWAYKTTHGAKATAVAYGAAMAESISGAGNTVAIVLAEIANNYNTGGVGTFTLNLTNDTSSSAATGATMSVIPLTAGGTTITAESLTIGTLAYTNANMVPGYYRVEVTLSRTGGLSTITREILHIYQGMTSTWTATLPPVNANVYTITYEFNHSSVTGLQNDINNPITHGGVIGGPTTDPSGLAVPTGSIGWGGWFKESSAPRGDEIVIGYRPYKTETYYGYWLPEGATISITYGMSGANDPQISATTDITLSGTGPYTGSINRNSAPTITFTVNNDDQYTSFSWQITTSSQISSTKDIEIDFSGHDFMLAGTHVITVTATKAGTPYTSTITIVVADS